MSGTRCALTELLVEQCSHCRAETDRQIPTDTVSGGIRLATFEAPRPRREGFPAMYRGECAACGGEVDEGELIVGTDDGWIHEGCQS